MVLTDQQIGPEGGGEEEPLAHCINKDEVNPVLPLTLHGLAWCVRLPAASIGSIALSLSLTTYPLPAYPLSLPACPLSGPSSPLSGPSSPLSGPSSSLWHWLPVERPQAFGFQHLWWQIDLLSQSQNSDETEISSRFESWSYFGLLAWGVEAATQR